MNLKFTNNASAKLAEAISSTSTTLKVESDKGSLFPSITSPEYFYVTLVGDSVMEIVKVTARNSDTFTIVRAQDGTTAQAFSAGDVVELRITAAAFNDISTAINELDAFPEQTGNSGKYLQTDGTNVKWSTVNTYPSQSGKSGQSLVTDGTSTLWHPLAQDILDAAEAAAQGSEGESGDVTLDSLLAGQTLLDAKVAGLENGVGQASDYIVETYRNGTEWYDIYKSGKIRQGGVKTGSWGQESAITVTLLKEYKNTDYSVSLQVKGTSLYSVMELLYYPTSNKAFDMRHHTSGGHQFTNGTIQWTAEGV